MSSLYLLFLLISTFCMGLCDWRWKLTFFLRPRRAGSIAAALVVAFLAWDALGIATGAFFRGTADYMTGLMLAPEMPVEEPVFLFFLVYLIMNLTTGARKVLAQA